MESNGMMSPATTRSLQYANQKTKSQQDLIVSPWVLLFIFQSGIQEITQNYLIM